MIFLLRVRNFFHHKWRNWRLNYHLSMVSPFAPWAYVSYLSDVFNRQNDAGYMNGHQNRREAIEIVRVLNSSGYNVLVHNFSSPGRLPCLPVKLVFGLEPNFNRASAKYPSAKKIYYATGAHYRHQNSQVIKMTDYVNEKYGASIPYRRLVPEHNSYDIADEILQIGSKYTIETYDESQKNKITIIHQSTQAVCIVKSLDYSVENQYFFMASSGNMLKGLPLVFEYFISHPALTVNIVGPIEDDYYALMKSKLTPNIHFYGFLDVRSDKMAEIMSRCNFLIYPSGSEGGCPGAVLNSMKNGLIPIVTRWAAFDEIEEYGFLMETWNVESLEAGVDWSRSLRWEEICSLKSKCVNFVSNTYSLKKFSNEFKRFIDG